MHGGAAGSGAQAGNRNALRHGRYSRELIELRRAVRAAAAREQRQARVGIHFAKNTVTTVKRPDPRPG